MKILFSPTKKMKENCQDFLAKTRVSFLEESQYLLSFFRQKSLQELQDIWECNEKIAYQNQQRFLTMDLTKNLSPALFSYEGISFQYLAPEVFSQEEFDYLQEHLCILSAFYGVVKAFDGIRAYRLEMNSHCPLPEVKSWYSFWGDKLYQKVVEDDSLIINLASVEYSSAIEKYLQEKDTMITCFFLCRDKGKLKNKGVYSKMARGAMLRFLTSLQSENPEDMKKFRELGFVYSKELSDLKNYYFIREESEKENES